MVNRDVILAKFNHVQTSLNRLKEKQALTDNEFLNQRDAQDIVLFNLQTAIQSCIDIASHVISDNNWSVPVSLGAAFDLLCEKKVISPSTRDTMRAMVGLRNLIVHEYATLDTSRIYSIYKNQLADFNDFLKEIAQYAKL